MPDSSSNIKQEGEPTSNDSEKIDIDSNQVKNRQAKVLTEINQRTVNRKLDERTAESVNSNFKIQKQGNDKALDREKENSDLKLTNNCCDEKLCPTYTVIVNRKRLSEGTLTKKLAELQKVRLEMGKDGQNINCCEQGKPCPILNSLLTKKVSKSELPSINSKTKCEVVGWMGYANNPSHKPTKQTSGIKEQGYIADIDSEAEKVGERPPDEGTAPDAEATQNQDSGRQEQEGDQGVLVIRKWKDKCNQFICEVKSLLDVCEKNPDYVLSSFKDVMGENKKVPGSVEIVNEMKKSYPLKDILGEKFGNPEYHLLMVDSSTSICNMDYTNPNFKTIEPRPHSISSKALQSVIIMEPEKSETMLHESEEASKSDTTIESKESDDSELESEKSGSSAEEKFVYEVENKAPNEEKGNIVLNEVSPRETEEEEKRNEKKNSEISFQSVSSPTGSESTVSLDEVVKDATAKAEHFRQNVDNTKQQGLIDISSKGNDINNKKEDNTTTALPPKRKKLFNFRCFQKKKNNLDMKMENEEKLENQDHSSLSEEESEDVLVKKSGHSFSSHLDSFHRRNPSIIENPVSEKKKKLNHFLENI